MGLFKLILFCTAFSLFLPAFVAAETIYLRVADGDEEGAIFVYHLKERIPEKYRKWIVKLDYGPEGETIVIPNLPDRVYQLDLTSGKRNITKIVVQGEVSTRGVLKNMMRDILQEEMKKDDEKARPGRLDEPIEPKPEKGNLWE
ncbi:MAG: hypothetical protein ACYTBS_11945 [Planctomycetota bacterium]